MSKILFAGATGYVGGSVLDQLVKSTESSLKVLTFDVLVRSEEQSKKLQEAYGERVRFVQWAGLEDTTSIENIAQDYDIVLNVGCAFIAPGAKAFVDGLARRVATGRPAPWLFTIAGCTNLADRPLTQPPQPVREWDDEADSATIFEYMKELDAREPYPQRTAEVAVLETAAASGVQAVSVNTPCIFGQGAGLFNQQGLVIPCIMRYIVRHGYGFKLNDTANFDWVHVLDLADVYVLLLRTVLERSDRGVGYLPTGKRGVIFPTVGRTLITEINSRSLDAAFELGILPREDTPKEKEIRLVSLQDIADELTAGSAEVAERGWGGHKATNGTLPRKLLGWKPSRTQEAWDKDFMDELVALKENRRGVTMESCIGVKK